ncbi:histidine kinase [Sphaerochaeta sp. PS]|uniref:sensor histidine kinase n=1 Tax=Sphaerochaeta sp. PS TaxID=3076336 RepID=UPI0028A2ED19|nr:histidine kinase [Sphaerochaeta sp. PS]MDT4761691.1 histidine kinase [Sphaerochaeta sp. PS]
MFRNIKARITIITVTFTLIITVLVATFSFFVFRTFSLQSLIQSTEFNLQFIGSKARENIIAIDSLIRWCTTNGQVSLYLEQGGNQIALSTYERVKEEMNNNRANAYVDRLIITDIHHTKLLHMGSTMSESKPVTSSNVDKVLSETFMKDNGWNHIGIDPFMSKASAQALPIRRVLTRSSSTEVTGQLYMTISSRILTDLLSDYRILPGSALYLGIGTDFYQIADDKFLRIERPSMTEEHYETIGEETQIFKAKLDGHVPQLLVSCPLGYQDLTLSQSLPTGKIPFKDSLYFSLIGTICIAVICFGLGLLLLLNRMINKPVAKIKKRVEAISQSDFSNDPSIEWDDEMGDIGKGINKLSAQISSLLEKRIADEKNKQELEYRMLQSQINPHFLFNTLNSIKWMATIQNATGIAEMTTSLSRLMKNISKATGMIISLGDELALLNDYFVIQKYRYGGTLVLQQAIPEEFHAIGIPRFSLQPLVENAIFHGIEPKGGSGTVTVSARRRDEDVIEISILDDGVGMNASQIEQIFSADQGPSSGMFKEIGIRNVHKRIQYTFGKEYGLSIESKEGSYTRATLLLPNREKEESHHDKTDNRG